MSHTQRSWLDRITFLLPHSTPTLVCPSNRSVSCIPQHGVPFGRLAEQSQVKGYEPTVLSRLAARRLRPSRRAGTGSTYNSGEDIATTPASSEVDERPYMGLLASPVLTQGEGSAAHSLQRRKCGVTFITRSYQNGETCGDVFARVEVKSRFTCFGVPFREKPF